MALVFGKSLLAAAPPGELNVSYTDFKGGAGEEDSDDEEYVYVSRLAEQIAAHAMLDEEEEDPCAAASPAMECYEEIAFSSYAKEVKLQKVGQVQDGDYSVSHFAAAWRDYGPTEWDCFYTPIPQAQPAKHVSSFHVSQRDQFHKQVCSWSALRYVHHKQGRPYAFESHGIPSQPSTQTFPCDSTMSKRKESIGTGVFLPKIVNTGSSHYRRKAGLSSRSLSYAPRSKF